jgi:hypothetical protein
MARTPWIIAIIASMTVVLGCDEPAKVQQGPPCTNCASSQDELIQLLAASYHDRDLGRFTDLFPIHADSADYAFFLTAPVNGVDNWDLTEELRIHRRMFDPSHPLPSEYAVPRELWLNTVTIALSRTTSSWVERTDLYKSPTNPTGLDGAKWRITEAEYHADILFNTDGDTDYRVDSRENFIVIQELAKSAGTPRRYRIYRWEDLDPSPIPAREAAVVTTPAAWGQIKEVYR